MLRKLVQSLFIAPVRFYQLTISPLTGNNCRHSPTCSQYTIEAIREWGPLRGCWMGLKRIARCHPWGTHGPDPVPKRAGNQNPEPIPSNPSSHAEPSASKP